MNRREFFATTGAAAAFELKDPAATTKLLQMGHVAATVIANENRIRLAPGLPVVTSREGRGFDGD